jgi:hypothetical protein
MRFERFVPEEMNEDVDRERYGEHTDGDDQ